MRELQERLGIASVATVHDRLRRLRQFGVVDWVDGQVRTLTVTPFGDETLDNPTRYS